MMTRSATRYSLVCVRLLTAMLLIQTAAAMAQPIVAFTGRDSDSPDEFAFVALVDLDPGTAFFVTNNDWNNATGMFDDTGEGTLLFTVAETIPRGTVTQVSETASNVLTVTGGNGTAVHFASGSDWTPTAADPHYAYTASDPAFPLTTVTEIYALMLTQISADPATDPTTGTNASTDAIVSDFTSEQPSGIDYSASRSQATNATLGDSTNFTTGPGQITLDLTSFFGINLIFEDDFETGDTTLWALAEP